jgi:hypothetical protein
MNNFNFENPSSYNFNIQTLLGFGKETTWGSSAAPIVVLDNNVDRDAIEIIFQMDPNYQPTPGYYPASDNILMRLDLLGSTGGFGGPFSTFSAIEKLEALVSLTGSGDTIIDGDFTITPLIDLPPPPLPLPPPLTGPSTVPVPGSGLLILSVLGAGVALSRRKRAA